MVGYMEKYQFTIHDREMMENMQVPFAVYQYLDKHIYTLIVSKGFCELFGYEDKSEAYYDMDNNMYKYTHPEDKATAENAAVRFAIKDDKYDLMYRFRRKNEQEYRIVHSYGKHVKMDDGTTLAYVWYSDEGLFSDVSENVLLSKKITEDIFESMGRESKFDYLTGLPNESYFLELADASVGSVIDKKYTPAILYIDLFGLRYYNHRYGFENGDKLLIGFARIISDIFGSDNCSRTGQDHFAVYTITEGLENKLHVIFDKLKELENDDIVHARVGIYHDLGTDLIPVNVAYDRAALACESLKGIYESAFCYYNKELRDDELNKQYIITNLDNALKNNWIHVYYQPIVRTVTGKVCDDEALSRWIDPVKGFLSPAEFIPILENAGLIYKLDLYVLERVIEKIKNLEKEGKHVVPQSINLSRSDFSCCDIVEEIRERVDNAGISRSLITIEITESVLGQNYNFMKEQITRFQNLGFSVWMDDFGSGYSSLDLLQSINFNLIKFDMGFMTRFNEGENGRIILTELMKMTSAIGVDTVCEGVETEEQVKFLREIGCAKLQGYYFSKPLPLNDYLNWTESDKSNGYENPEETSYYDSIGKINLYDLTVVANEGESSNQDFFNTIPMGIIEVKDDTGRFVRSNQSYRDFIKRFFGYDLSYQGSDFVKISDPFMMNIVNTCCKDLPKSFFDETMPDGSIIHSFSRRIGTNPVTGITAVVVAILSISKPNHGATYASIARALASDYYNIYYVDLETDDFIEYTSPIGGEIIAEERHGKKFFDECLEAAGRIYEEDRAHFFEIFSKEKIIRGLDEQGVFTITYRLVDMGYPMYVAMKINRMPNDKRFIIMGISIIDSQMKHQEELEKERQSRRLAALSGEFYSIYEVNIENGKYREFNSTGIFSNLGIPTEGEDFFTQGLLNARKVIHKDDFQRFSEQFNKEHILYEIKKNGLFKLRYRLVINGVIHPVTLKASILREKDEDVMIVGVNIETLSD